MTLRTWAVAIVLVIACGLIAGVRLGSADGIFNSFLAALLDPAARASKTKVITKEGVMDEYDVFIGAKAPGPEDFIDPAVRDHEVGLTFVDRRRFRDGYTLYSPFYFGFPIRLTDQEGVTLHEWVLPESAYTGERLDNFQLGESAQPMVSMLHVYPDGDLLVVFSHGRLTEPYGYGLARIDKDSNLEWTYLRQAHHVFDIAPDGRIYAIVIDLVEQPLPAYEWIEGPVQEDYVVVLSPQGEEINRVSILDAIKNSEFASLLMYGTTEPPEGDLLHLNAVRHLSAEQASHIPGAEEGNVLLSMRNLNVVAVMDLEEPTIKWAMRGPWHMQHDAQLLDNGNLLVFDNRGDMYRSGASRILEVDPVSEAIEWLYPQKADPFYTVICGSVQRLDNGNTLISETNNGRIFEVTAQGNIVWDYSIPERFLSDRKKIVSKAWSAQRIDPADVPFVEELETIKP